MEANCLICDKKLLEEEINENELQKSKCNDCHIHWLRDNIRHLSNSLFFMRAELKEYLSKKIVWSDNDSTSGED